MANQANIKAVVTAEDKGSATISKFGNTVGQLGGQVSKVNTQSQAASISFGKMTGAVAAGTLVYDAFTRSLGRVNALFTSSLQSANRYQGAILGLSSVATAFGHSSQIASEAAKSLAQDGLLTVADAATGLKNLLATGFSLDESTALMNRFKDTAAFGRQAALGFGEAIRGATEGIKNGNSILTDNAGITKNLSVILQEAGKSQQDVMNITSDASVRQALYNGLLRESLPMVGDAAKLSGTFAGAQARAAAQTEIFKQNLGSMLQTVGGPLLSAFSDFISKNQDTIIAFGLASIAAVGLTTGLLGLLKVGSMVVSGLAAMTATTGVLGIALLALGAIVGQSVFKAVGSMQEKVKQANEGLTKTEGAGTIAERGLNKASDGARKLTKELAKIGQQIERANRDFRENLAQMIKDSEDKVRSLRKQLSTEEEDFKEAQDKMVEDHQDRVKDIEKQIEEERRMGVLADQMKITDLQSRLAKENAEFDKQKAKEVERHNEQMAEMQAELNAENALLEKHAADVASIRDVMLLDQIEKLKRSHDEQLAAFEQQKQDAIENAKGTTSAVGSIYDDFARQQNENFANIGSTLGSSMGAAFKDAILKEFGNTFKGIGRFVIAVNATLFDMMSGKWILKRKNPWELLQENWMKSSIGGENVKFGRAIGGAVQAGTPYRVGEQGPETFVPHTSGTIVPANKTGSMGGNQNINITIKAQAFTGSQMEARRFATMLMSAYNDAMRAKGMANA